MAEGGGDSGIPVKAESQPINIVVRDQTNHEVHFKIKTTTKFEKVFNAYCDKKSLTLAAVKFVYDGQRLAPESTPATFEMEDNDVIDVMVEQIGGHSPALQLMQ